MAATVKIALVVLLLALAAYGLDQGREELSPKPPAPEAESTAAPVPDPEPAAEPSPPAADGEEGEIEMKLATFAGGCFWCLESPFDALPGVSATRVGYTGGETEAPTYRQVCGGDTGHLEAIQIAYDPERVDYQALLDTFWRQIDPTDAGGQFADRGEQYTTAIFYHDEEQRRLAEESRAALERSGRFDRPIATVIRPAAQFYEAEEYHQDYYRKQPFHYGRYRRGSGREGFIRRAWGETAPAH